MRILKVWGNDSGKKREIDIDLGDWSDYAPDLSEFFDDKNNSAKETQAEKEDEPIPHKEFEIDWNAVRAREDWVTAPPQKKFEQNQNANSAQYIAQTESSRQKQSYYNAPQKAYEADEIYEEYDDEKRRKHSNKSRKKTKNKVKTKEKTVYIEEGKPKKKHRFRNFVLVVIIFAGLYGTAVFSNIPFIEKWRTIYIETAMSTMNHQWLATAFLPPSVIAKVVGERETVESQQEGLASTWHGVFGDKKEETTPWKKLEKKFYKEYPEIDEKTFSEYMNGNEGTAIDKNGYLMIDKAGLKDEDTGIETVHGDKVLAVDTENGITIAKVTGDGYVGRLAIIKDPSRVGIALASGYGNSGSFASDIAKKKKAVLAINASGFFDPEGKGNGGVAHGVVISNGKKYSDAVGGTYKTIALDEKDRLNIGQYKDISRFRDAVEFKPALIIDGKTVVKGSAGWGVQPRSAIGQAEDGTIFMLIIDGRAPGYSIGATVGECAEILAKYGAVQACNLDGGSSSIMIYRGREISKPSAANKEKGRHIPDSFVVYEK